jgi:hypothetical protein
MSFDLSRIRDPAQVGEQQPVAGFLNQTRPGFHGLTLISDAHRTSKYMRRFMRDGFRKPV